MLKLPERFVVDRATWLRGGIGELLTSAGSRCCVGFLAKEMGISDAEMLNRQVLGEVTDEDAELPGSLCSPRLITGADDLGAESYVDGEIYDTNDDEDIDDDARESRLTALFAAIGIEVRFEGEGNPTPPEAP